MVGRRSFPVRDRTVNALYNPVEILSNCEVRDHENQFKYSIVTYCNDGSYVLVNSSMRSWELDADNIQDQDGTVIPNEHIFPRHEGNIGRFDPTGMERLFIQKPDLDHYSPDDPTSIPRKFLHEVKIHEDLRKSPHPNIVRYAGCVVVDRLIQGIALERCFESLYDRTWMRDQKVNKDFVIDSVWKGARHLHGLGYCHNNISVHTIMFREDDTIVLRDFYSSFPIGETLGARRTTPPFARRDATVSDPENDFYSIGQVKEYLETGKLNGMAKVGTTTYCE